MKKIIIVISYFIISSGCTSLRLQRDTENIPFAYSSIAISGYIKNKTVTEAFRELTNISIEALRKEKCSNGISCVVAGSISRPELLEKTKTIKFSNVSIKAAYQLVAIKYEMFARYKNGCFIIEDILDTNNNGSMKSSKDENSK